MRFSAKITMIFSGMVLVLCFLVTYFVYTYTAGVLEDQTRDDIKDQAVMSMNDIDMLLVEKMADVRVLATDPVLKSRASTPGEIRARLVEFREKYRSYSSISFFDPNRVRIADTSGIGIGLRHSFSEYWPAMAAGRDSVIEASRSESLKADVFHFAAKVMDHGGRPRGVVVARIKVFELGPVLERYSGSHSYRQDFEMELLDKNGVPIYSNYNKKGVLKEVSPHWAFIKDRIASGQRSGTVRHLSEMEGRGDEIAAFASEKGAEGFKGSDWTLVLDLPVRAAFAPARALRDRILAVMLIIGGCSLVLVYIFSRVLTRSLEKLSAASERVGRGDLDIGVSAGSNDEIGRLSRSFNRMVSGLKDSRMKLLAHSRELEAKVEERTAEIKVTNERLGVELGVRKAAEEALRAAHDEMEARVRERTEELRLSNALLQAEIAEHKQAEEDLRLHDVILTNMPGGAFLIRCSDSVIVYASPGLERMFGYGPGELNGRHVSVVNAPGDKTPEEAAREIGGILKREKTWTGEVRNIKKDGTHLWCVANVSTFNHPAYGPVWVAVNTDITERKKMEEELVRAQRLESIGLLAGGIAHDFNNLLSGILSNISLAMMLVEPGGKLNKILGGSEKAALRANDLTRQLLTFSRGGAPVKKTTRLNHVLEEWASFALKGSRVVCEFSIAPDLWAVEADEGQISQVINNLVINADQAMPDGGTITLKAENAVLDGKGPQQVKEGRYIRITLSDTGIGIPGDMLNRIFDPYFTTKQKGSGLGLATSYSIIKRHGGSVTVESKTGAGTAFTIYLPASGAAAAPEAVKEDASVVHRGAGRILVMDDEEMIREAAGEILEFAGYEAGFARDGAEAIDLYRKAKDEGRGFDAVIMDLTIPGGMGGKDAVRELLKFDPGARAIVSSGYSNDPIIAEYREYGFTGVVEKPYTTSRLTAAVKDALKGGA